MISKSQYTHMLRACRFVVRRSHNINIAQRLLAANSDNYLKRLRPVIASTDMGYISVSRTTAVTDWKDIWREPIANITSPFLLEGYQSVTEAAHHGFHSVSLELYPRMEPDGNIAYEQVYVLYADTSSSPYHGHKIPRALPPTGCLCCNPQLNHVRTAFSIGRETRYRVTSNIRSVCWRAIHSLVNIDNIVEYAINHVLKPDAELHISGKAVKQAFLAEFENIHEDIEDLVQPGPTYPDVAAVYEFMAHRCIVALDRAYALNATAATRTTYTTPQPHCVKRLAQRVFNAIWAYMDHIVHQVISGEPTLTRTEQGSTLINEVLQRAYAREPTMDNFGLVRSMMTYGSQSFE
jgi:hypothetical protein